MSKKQVRWSKCRDFVADNNGTPAIEVKLDSAFQAGSGCGINPMEILISSEALNHFDIMADKLNWSGADRLKNRAIYDTLPPEKKGEWLRLQANIYRAPLRVEVQSDQPVVEEEPKQEITDWVTACAALKKVHG